MNVMRLFVLLLLLVCAASGQQTVYEYLLDSSTSVNRAEVARVAGMTFERLPAGPGLVRLKHLNADPWSAPHLASVELPVKATPGCSAVKVNELAWLSRLHRESGEAQAKVECDRVRAETDTKYAKEREAAVKKLRDALAVYLQVPPERCTAFFDAVALGQRAQTHQVTIIISDGVESCLSVVPNYVKWTRNNRVFVIPVSNGESASAAQRYAAVAESLKTIPGVRVIPLAAVDSLSEEIGRKENQP